MVRFRHAWSSREPVAASVAAKNRGLLPYRGGIHGAEPDEFLNHE